jgi:hypothetical protein
LLTAPPPEHETVAAIGDPVYVCGEFVTDAVWFALLMMKLPAATSVPALKNSLAAQSAVTA